MAQTRANKRKASTYHPENVTCSGKTGVELDKISYLWTVENYSVLANDYKELKSPVFRGGSKYNHSWQLCMYPKKSSEETDYLGLLVGLIDFGDTDGADGDNSADRVVKAHYQLSILNQAGVAAVKSFSSYRYRDFKKASKRERSKDFWGKSKLVSVEDLLSNRMGLVVDDSFTILCEIWIHGEVKESGASRLGPSEEERTKIRQASLLNDFGKLFKESIGSDVTIKTKRASFEAHKCVLMVRSPVFAAMFSAKMKEKEENVVEITDFDDKVVEGMLEHLYTGRTDCMDERAEDLLKISEKYDLPELKKDCEFAIAHRLCKKNAAVTLILAHSHNAPYLKQRTIDFINKNKKELLKSKPFVEAVKAHADVDLFSELYFWE